MKLHIPTIGDCLKLTADWTFTLHHERRNFGYLKTLVVDNYMKSNRQTQHTLPAGTVLKVERVYIRSNLRDYDSITFRVVGVKRARFWVKLHDANCIECDHVEPVQ